MNPFMVWSQYQRRIICEKTPDLHNTVISKQLGQKWRELSEDEKQPFVVEADKLRKLHSIEYPDYKYRPKKKQQGSKSTTSTSLPSPSSSTSPSTASGKVNKSHIREVSKRKKSNTNFKNDSNNNKSVANNKNNINSSSSNSINSSSNNNNNSNNNTKTLEEMFGTYYYPNSPDSINNGVGVGCGSTGTTDGDMFSDSELQQPWTTYEPYEDDTNVMDIYTCSTPTNTNGLGFDSEDTKHNIIVNDPNMNPGSIPMFTDIDACVINQQIHNQRLQQQIDQSQHQQQQSPQNHLHQQQQQPQQQQHHHQQQILFNDSSLQQTQAEGALPSFVNSSNSSIAISGNFQMDTSCNTIEMVDSTDLTNFLQQLSSMGGLNPTNNTNNFINYMNGCNGDNGSCGDDGFNGFNNFSLRVTTIDDEVNTSDLNQIDLNLVLNRIDSDANLSNATGSHLEFRCDNKNLYKL